MLAKILVGVVAAIAVTGVGVYYAMPDYAQPGCCGKSAGNLATPVSDITECPVDGETPSCCAAKAMPVSEGASCCAAKAKTSADSLGACVGGMALTNAAPTAKKAHCCEE